MAFIQTDIIIIGGGLVGSALAIALAQGGICCHVVERGKRADIVDAAFDGRASAISEASCRVLRSVGAWEGMAADAEPICDIRVVDGYSTATVHYDHKDLGNEPFGYLIANTAIRASLIAQAEAQPNVTMHYEAEIADKAQDASGAQVTLASGETLKAPLLIAADGRFSTTRDWAGIEHRVAEYGQTAMVCTIKHEKPHEGVAVERFFPRGPFAVLPMTQRRSCIVWSESHDMAEHMLSLSEAQFCEELHTRMNGWLGELALEGKRFAYPLTLVQADSYAKGRVALVGDAAHGIHPIAGQGVNLGYRDVAVLAELLVKQKQLGLDLGSAECLAHYQRWRAFDAASMSVVMDGLTRLFSNDIAPIRLARRLGLRAVDKLPPLKGFFMLHAMGLLGDLPEMLEEGAA